MDSNIAEKIRVRAYQLWQQASEPDGSEQEFWLQAEQEHFWLRAEQESNERHDQGIWKNDKAQEQPKDKERAQDDHKPKEIDYERSADISR